MRNIEFSQDQIMSQLHKKEIRGMTQSQDADLLGRKHNESRTGNFTIAGRSTNLSSKNQTVMSRKYQDGSAVDFSTVHNQRQNMPDMFDNKLQMTDISQKTSIKQDNKSASSKTHMSKGERSNTAIADNRIANMMKRDVLKLDHNRENMLSLLSQKLG